MPSYFKVRQKKFPAVLNAVAMNASNTSSSFSVVGRNVVSIHVNCTRVAYTAMTFYLEVSDDGGSNWRRQLAAEVSIAAGAATATRGTETDSLTTSSSVKFMAVYNNVVAGSQGLARVVFPAATAAGATDLLTVDVVVQ